MFQFSAGFATSAGQAGGDDFTPYFYLACLFSSTAAFLLSCSYFFFDFLSCSWTATKSVIDSMPYSSFQIMTSMLDFSFGFRGTCGVFSSSYFIGRSTQSLTVLNLPFLSASLTTTLKMVSTELRICPTSVMFLFFLPSSVSNSYSKPELTSATFSICCQIFYIS